MTTWSPVTRRAATVAILTCGPSLTGWPIERLRDSGAYVLAVNHAVTAAPWVDGWHTQDVGAIDMGRFDYLRTWPGERYIASPPPARPYRVNRVFPQQPIDGATYLERVHRWELFDDPTKCASGWNSSYSALQVAAHMRPVRLAIFGLDLHPGQVGRYWFGRGHPGPDQSYQRGRGAFSALAAAGGPPFDLVVANPDSAVTEFPWMTPDEAVAWLSRS